MKRQRVGAYALAFAEDRVLLCRMSARTKTPGAWTLPGGGVEHGEDPADAALRELLEETGLQGTIVGLVGVHSNVYTGAMSGDRIHGIRLIYLVHADRGQIQDEAAGTTDGARWIRAADVPELDLSAHARFGLAEHKRRLRQESTLPAGQGGDTGQPPPRYPGPGRDLDRVGVRDQA